MAPTLTTEQGKLDRDIDVYVSRWYDLSRAQQTGPEGSNVSRRLEELIRQRNGDDAWDRALQQFQYGGRISGPDLRANIDERYPRVDGTAAPGQAGSENGKALSNLLGDDILTFKPEVIRKFADDLDSHAASLTGLAGEPLQNLGTVLSEKAKAFTSEKQQSPIYGGTMEAMVHTTDKYRSNLSALSKQLTDDAASLRWIAASLENQEESSALEIRKII